MFNDDIDLFNEFQDGVDRKRPIPGLRAQHLYPSGSSVVVTNPQGRKLTIGGCQRKQYLQYKEESRSDQGYITEDIGPAEVGNLLQDYVEKELFEKADLFLQSELQLYLSQWNVSGRADTMIRKVYDVVTVHRPSEGTFDVETKDLQQDDVIISPMKRIGKYYGVEVKSKDGYFAEKSYIRANKSGAPTDFRPADEHIIQSLIYLYAFSTIPGLKKYNIDSWFVFYVLRGDGRYNYFRIEMTDHSSQHGFGYPIIYSYAKPDGFVYKRFGIQDVIKRWEELNFCINNNVLPDRDYELIYSPSTLQSLLAEKSSMLNKENKGLVASGQYQSVMTGKGTQNERALGDFECYACPYKSKCWGLNNLPLEDFDCLHSQAGAKRVNYSEFDPFSSTYFDKLDDETKDQIRGELGKDA